MLQDSIKCPKCGTSIKLSEALSGDMETALKSKYEKELEIKLTAERKLLQERAEKAASDSVKMELSDLKEQLDEKARNLEKAQQQELELRKNQRKLEEDRKAFELEMNRKLDNERQSLIEKISGELEESRKFKDAEKDKQLTEMKNQINVLQRKAEQASQQGQGEVLELELEQLFKNEFPFDAIEPVAKGVKGGDIVHVVKTQAGRICGKILWEAKRTRSWSDSWIPKLKDDQRSSKADIAVIVSETLPKGFHHFRQMEGVWVTDIPSSMSLAAALRVVLTQVELSKEIQTGKEEKMEVMYNYFTGTEFRNRVQSMVESFVEMRKDLDSEKRAFEKIWAKREKQIERIVLNIAGMNGDIEGITGTALPSVKLLELPIETTDRE